MVATRSDERATPSCPIDAVYGPLRVPVRLIPRGDWTPAIGGSKCLLRPPAAQEESAFAAARPYHIELRTSGASAPALDRKPSTAHRRCGTADRLHLPGGWVEIAPGRRHAIVRHPRADTATGRWIAGMLLDIALAHAAALCGQVVLHAAGLRLAGLDLLVLAPNRGGKSTFCAAGLAAGARIASDDLLLLHRREDGTIQAHGLRATLVFREGGLAALPPAFGNLLQPWRSPTTEPRWTLSVEPIGPPSALRPTHGLILRTEPQRPDWSLQPLSQGEFLAELLRSSSPLLAAPRYERERKALLEVLARLTATATAARLRMGHALLTQPEAVLRRVRERLSPFLAT